MERSSESRRPRLLVAVVLLYLGLGVLWTALIPPFEKPDEIHHFAYVQFMSAHWRIPKQAQERWPFLEAETQQPPLYYAFAALAYRASRLSGMHATDLASWDKRINPSHGAPPPAGGKNFFRHEARFLDPPGVFAYDVLLVRLVSLGLGALTLVWIHRTAAQVFPEDVWLPLLSTALVATLPQFTFVSTSVSNDVMGYALGAFILYRLVSVDSRLLVRDYAILGVLMGLSILVKLTLLSLLPLVLLPLLRRDLRAKERWSAVALFVAAFSALAGWWFIRNVLTYGDVLGRQEVINPAAYAWNIDRKQLSSPYFRSLFWRLSGQSFVGKFGFMRIDMPPAYYAAWRDLLLVSVAGLVTGFVTRLSRRPRRWRDVAAGRPALLGGAVAGALAALLHYNLTVSQPQGRYLFHVLAAIACLFVMGVRELARPVSERLPVFLSSETGRAAAAMSTVGALAALNLFALFGVALANY